ncbi:MAG: acetylpolyamine amidohydrolase, partial [Sphingomonas hengshuiensis]
MRAFFAPAQRLHAPAQELHNGGFIDYAESPARADAM